MPTTSNQAGSKPTPAAETHIGGEETREAANTEPLELIICHPKGVASYVATGSESPAATAGIVCSLFDRGGIIALLDAHATGTEFDSLSAALQHEHVQGTVEYLYFYDEDTLAALSSEDQQALVTSFEAGAPVGLGGTDGAALATALNLPKGHDAASAGARASHFVHRSATSTEHFVVEPGQGWSFGDLLGRVMDWEERTHKRQNTGPNATSMNDARPMRLAALGGNLPAGVAPAPSVFMSAVTSASVGAGWTYCKSYEYTGTVQDSGNDVGGYNMSYSFYYVDKKDVNDDYNRWLVVVDFVSSMSNYYNDDGNKQKGWYMRSMGVKMTLGEYLGDISEWSPSTSVGSTSTTSTIGAGISASGPDANYSIATTNSTDDVSIMVDGDLTKTDGVNGQDWVEWDVDFAKCGSNSSDTKLKDPAAAAQGLWSEEFALYTVNKDDGEGVKLYVAPSFQVQHCRCGSNSCPIRNTVTKKPWGDNPGNTFQVFKDTCR